MALDYYEQYQDENIKSTNLALESSKSKLEVVQSKLNPHFFNALNMKTVQIIPLKEELLLVSKYLAIEQERFSDRLTIEIKIDPMTESLGIPNLILQPILENTFKYGVSENLDSSHLVLV